MEIIRHAQQTSFTVSSGGISWIRLVNNLGIARKIRKVLAQLGPTV